MKAFVSVDMEGISGLVRWADVVTAGIDFARNRRFMTLDANAAIAGAFDGGATEVVVEENHGVEELCDLLLDEIDPRCRVVRGAGRPFATTMAALDASVGVVLLVGHHARAGELGVPVGLITGDQIVIEQLRARAPWAEAVEVKRALSNVAGDVIPPARAQVLIRTGARRAVERARAGELQAYRAEPAPYTIEVELRQPLSEDLRDNLGHLPEFEITDERTVCTIAPDMDLGFRRIAYMGYGHQRGMVRY